MTDPMLRRLAALAEIADRRKGSSRLGKTAAQKLLYLLQEVGEIDLGYRFDLYTYGPYDPAVMRDIDYGQAIGVLDVQYDKEQGYSISLSANAADIASERSALLSESESAFQNVFSLFGSMTARDLELRATIVYVVKDDPSLDDSGVFKIVQDLKPKYEPQQIKSAIAELKKENLLKPAQTRARKGKGASSKV